MGGCVGWLVSLQTRYFLRSGIPLPHGFRELWAIATFVTLVSKFGSVDSVAHQPSETIRPMATSSGCCNPTTLEIQVWEQLLYSLGVKDIPF